MSLNGSLSVVADEEYKPSVLVSKPKFQHHDMNYNDKGLEASFDSGLVELIYTVDEAGLPNQISVLRSSQTKFDSAAINLVKKYK